jgi:hypothetical protein
MDQLFPLHHQPKDPGESTRIPKLLGTCLHFSIQFHQAGHFSWEERKLFLFTFMDILVQHGFILPIEYIIKDTPTQDAIQNHLQLHGKFIYSFIIISMDTP